MSGVETVSTETISKSGRSSSERMIPEETPIAIEFNGIGYAVMMASPTDLKDFGVGFALSEGMATDLSDIVDVVSHETDKGWLLKIQLVQSRVSTVADRVRIRVSEGSCGLCGLKNLDQVLRPLPPITAKVSVADEALFKAVNLLRQHQPMNAESGGVHAAAFCAPDGSILVTREDVGRHNALDKLIGNLARTDIHPETGFILLSSRCSYELVEKTVIAGCPLLVTVSTATSLAVSRARESNLALIALARADSMIDFSGR